MVIVKKCFQLHPIRWSKEGFHSFQQLYHIPFGWDVRRNIDDNVNKYIFLSNKMHHICNNSVPKSPMNNLIFFILLDLNMLYINHVIQVK